MNEQQLRNKLPIGQHEKILLTTKHHWYSYVSILISAGFICLVLFGALLALVFEQDSLGINDQTMSAITAVGLTVIGCVGLFSLIPVWLKQQELLILTEEALMQYNKPTLFTSKVSQLNLQHVADVTVKQDAIGSLVGFGHIAIETPGEQDNYEFNVVSQPNIVAKAIVEAHENYAAALESGQIQTTLGQRPPVPGNAWRPSAPTPQSFGSDQQVSPTQAVPAPAELPAQPAPDWPPAAPPQEDANDQPPAGPQAPFGQ